MSGRKKDRCRKSRQGSDTATILPNPSATPAEPRKPATTHPEHKVRPVILTALIGFLTGVLLTEPAKVILNPIYARLFGKKDELKPSAPAAQNQLPKQEAPAALLDTTAAIPGRDEATMAANAGSTTQQVGTLAQPCAASATPTHDAAAIASRFYAEVRVQNTGDRTAINAQMSVEPPSKDLELELDPNGTRTEPPGWEHVLPAKDAPSPEHPHVHLIDIDRLPPGYTIIFHYFVRSTKYFPTLQLAVKATAEDYKEILHPTSSVMPLEPESTTQASATAAEGLDQTPDARDRTATAAVDRAVPSMANAHRNEQQTSEADPAPSSPPMLVAVSPNAGQVTITGDFTRFVSGSTVDFGSGTTGAARNGSDATPVTVANPKTLVAAVSPVTFTYTYDQAGQLVTVADSQGNTTTYTNDDVGNLTSSTHAQCQMTLLAYDDNGRLRSVTDSLGRTMTYAYDHVGNRTSRAGVQGPTYTYDVLNRLSSAATTQQTVYAFDYANRLVAVIDRLGNITTYAYDQVSNPRAVTDSLTTYTYDAFGNRLLQTSTPSQSVAYNYDLNQLLSVTDSLGNGITYTYDPSGNRTLVTDARGNTITYTYDVAGNLLSSTDARRQTPVFTYDGEGHVQSVTDPLGGTATYSYDNAGNLTSWTDALGRTMIVGTEVLGRSTAATLVNSTGLITGADSRTLIIEGASPIAVTSSLGIYQGVGIDAPGQIIIFNYGTAASPRWNLGTLTLGSNDYSFVSVASGIDSPLGQVSCSYRAAVDTSGTISLSTVPSCVWTVTGSDWITIGSGGSGMGNVSVMLAVSANVSLATRTGMLIVSGTPFVTVATPITGDVDGDGLTNLLDRLSLLPTNGVQLFNPDWGWAGAMTSGCSSLGSTAAQSRSLDAVPNISSRNGGDGRLRVKILNHGGSQLSTQTRFVGDVNGDGSINGADIRIGPSPPLKVTVLKDGGAHLSVTSTIAESTTRNGQPTTCDTQAPARRSPSQQPPARSPVSALPIAHKNTRNQHRTPR